MLTKIMQLLLATLVFTRSNQCPHCTKEMQRWDRFQGINIDKYLEDIETYFVQNVVHLGRFQHDKRGGLGRPC